MLSPEGSAVIQMAPQSWRTAARTQHSRLASRLKPHAATCG